MNELYIGVMSGTSLDGVDISLCEIKNDSFELVNWAEYPFDIDLKEDILKAINDSITLKKIGEIDIRLAKLFSSAINTFIVTNKINKKSVKAIGLHGQTLWHEPNSKYPFSMQLGNANVVTLETGIKVVSDFRQKDVSLGGQGAPFAPAFHQYLFSRLDGDIAVLNIGGMANLSLLGENLIGFDTGCGNVLMDLWINKNKSLAYDKDGDWAKSGEVNKKLLNEMLTEAFFEKVAPKSTGRELFNDDWLKLHLDTNTQLKAEDVQATLLELTVTSVAKEVQKTDTTLLIVCGGGVKNIQLMKRLDNVLWDVEVVSSDECGVSSEYMESMAFAWLAYKRIHKEKVQLSSVTGAKEDTTLGVIYE